MIFKTNTSILDWNPDSLIHKIALALMWIPLLKLWVISGQKLINDHANTFEETEN